MAANGSIGAGEAFIHGYWTTPDLTSVVRVMVSNLEVLDAMEGGLARLARPFTQGLHWLNRNTRKGSQKTSPPTTTWATTCSKNSSTRP